MDAQTTLREATLFTDGIEYLLISLPPQAITVAAGILAEVGEPFGGVILDKDEVTLIIAAEVVEDFQKRLIDVKVSEPYRLITFDLELPPTLTGFMAEVARILAEAKIPIIPLGAFARDHILIPAAHFETAWQVLNEAKSK